MHTFYQILLRRVGFAGHVESTGDNEKGIIF
jgi:hypothetical protein